jgi:hypothetical protein
MAGKPRRTGGGGHQFGRRTTFDAAEIGLRASLTPDPQGRMVRLEAHIDARDVALVHEGDRYNGELRLAIVGYTAAGQPQRGPLAPLDLHYSAPERDTELREGIPCVQNVSLPASVTTVRLVVFDRGSNAIGSVTLLVPEAGSATPR